VGREKEKAMLTKKKLTLMGAAGATWGLSALLLAPMAHGATFSDAAAAVVVYPKIVVTSTRDTVVTLTNASNHQIAAHCFYVNANNRCTNTGQVCTSQTDCFSDGITGACTGGWIEVNFDVILTPDQPLAWSAEDGLQNSDLPCNGGLFNGSCAIRVCKGAAGNPRNGVECQNSVPDCAGGTCAFANNAGAKVPPVGETPFIGELKCIEADPLTRLPVACDPAGPPCPADLEGTAIITTAVGAGTDAVVDTARYNAIGLRPTGFNNGDNTLVIGGPLFDSNHMPIDENPCPTNASPCSCLNNPDPAARCEYQACPEVLVFNHLFDGAVDPISGVALANSELTLVPCTEDLDLQKIPQVTAQFLVYNEFEQRVSASRLVNCLLNTPISLIDTSQQGRSIWSAGVQGTVSGQTRITGVGGGLLGAATLTLCDPSGCNSTVSPFGTSGYNLNQFADRVDPDFIQIP
jgi:hypothetical protein